MSEVITVAIDDVSYQVYTDGQEHRTLGEGESQLPAAPTFDPETMVLTIPGTLLTQQTRTVAITASAVAVEAEETEPTESTPAETEETEPTESTPAETEPEKETTPTETVPEETKTTSEAAEETVTPTTEAALPPGDEEDGEETQGPNEEDGE